MHLSVAQLQILKVDIAADPVLNALPNTPDGNHEIATAYNQIFAPAFIVWRTFVAITAIGDAMLQSDIANLTTGNLQRLQVIAQYAPNGLNPSRSDRRAGFQDIFSVAGAVNTRNALDALWRRSATRIERLFADTSGGNGTTATPAMLTVEGLLHDNDVLAARQLP